MIKARKTFKGMNVKIGDISGVIQSRVPTMGGYIQMLINDKYITCHEEDSVFLI